MSMFDQVRHYTTVSDFRHLPGASIPEVAFVGRSNAGKSAALNALCNRTRLAFSSRTPGRTRQINFFAAGAQPGDAHIPQAFLVDLPGYGYAKVAREVSATWEELLGRYLRERASLVGLVLIIDARRMLTDLDRSLLEWVPAGRPVHALLTKADKLGRSEARDHLGRVRHELTELAFSAGAQLFSSVTRVGVEDARTSIAAMLGIAMPDVAGQRKAGRPAR